MGGMPGVRDRRSGEIRDIRSHRMTALFHGLEKEKA
jgi:hypothetical protein